MTIKIAAHRCVALPTDKRRTIVAMVVRVVNMAARRGTGAIIQANKSWRMASAVAVISLLSAIPYLGTEHLTSINSAGVAVPQNRLSIAPPQLIPVAEKIGGGFVLHGEIPEHYMY